MEQETQKPKWKRRLKIGYLLLALIGLSFTLCVILTPLGPIFDFFPAPVVTPAHSAQELWDNPLPTPEWITHTTTLHNDLYDFFIEDYSLCVKIYLDAIWDWDAGYIDPGKLLHRTTGITVDETAIPSRDIGVWFAGHPIEFGCVQYPGELLPKTAGVIGDGIRTAAGNMDILTVNSEPALRYVDDDCHILNGPNYICFDTPPLGPGLHTATIRIENNAGVPYSYEWAFQVRE